MEVCFPCLCVRGVQHATWTRPFQVNGNDEGIAITSSSFFLKAHPSWVVSIGKHGCRCSRLFYHGRAHFIQFCELRVERVPRSSTAMVVPSRADSV